MNKRDVGLVWSEIFAEGAEAAPIWCWLDANGAQRGFRITNPNCSLVAGPPKNAFTKQHPSDELVPKVTRGRHETWLSH